MGLVRQVVELGRCRRDRLWTHPLFLRAAALAEQVLLVVSVLQVQCWEWVVTGVNLARRLAQTRGWNQLSNVASEEHERADGSRLLWLPCWRACIVLLLVLLVLPRARWHPKKS